MSAVTTVRCAECSYDVRVVMGVIEAHPAGFDQNVNCPATGLTVHDTLRDASARAIIGGVHQARADAFKYQRAEPAVLWLHGRALAALLGSRAWTEGAKAAAIYPDGETVRSLTGTPHETAGHMFGYPMREDPGLPDGMWRLADEQGRTLTYGVVTT